MPARTDRARRAERIVFMIISSVFCILANVTTASPSSYVARLARTERWRHAPVTNVDHFGIEPDSTSSCFRAISLHPEHLPRASRGLDSLLRAASMRNLFWPDWQIPMAAGCSRGMVFWGEEVWRAVLRVRGEHHAPDLYRSRDSCHYRHCRRGRRVGGQSQYDAARRGCAYLYPR